jgi:hypothetical protein
MEVSTNCYRSSKEKGTENIIDFSPFFGLAVKVELQAYKPCTFLKSTSNFLPEKVRYLFEGQPKIFNLQSRCRCNKHMQLLGPQGFRISQKTQITPP